MRYALATSMAGLVACPFCREMRDAAESATCPDCGLQLTAASKLPPRAHADLDDDELLPPHMETLPWTYAGRNRALLVAVAASGLAMFFAPWVHETAPELRTMSGFDLAQMLGWMWAPAVAWFVIIPLVASRRSIYKMRGARVAVAFLAAIVITTVGVRLGFEPASSSLRPVRLEWAWGLYATGALGLAAFVAALGFGGRIDDVPTKRPRPGGETLH
jgi:hypothetical protein